MPGPPTTPTRGGLRGVVAPGHRRPHRAQGSWAPRLAGFAVVVVLAGGALGVYLGTSHAAHPVTRAHHHHRSAPAKVVSVQTVGVIDFGPDDDGDPWQHDPDDHPLMLLEKGQVVQFVPIPPKEISNGTPEWTANQMTDGSEIFIYVPTGQCLSAAARGAARGAASRTGGGTAGSGAELKLSQCDLGRAQRWHQLNSRVVLGQAIAQYANAQTGECLTAMPHPGPARLTRCGKARTRAQEIAFWWSA